MLGGEVYGGVRGPSSAANLESLSRELPIIGDAAFFMFRPWNVGGERPSKNILINRGTHSEYLGKDNVTKAMYQFIGLVLSQGFNVSYLPFHAIDVVLGNELKVHFPAVRILDIPKTHLEASQHFENASYAIGERLHFVVMSILMGCPFLSVNYAAKHFDLLASLDLTDAGTAPDLLDLDLMVRLFSNRKHFDWSAINDRIRRLKASQEQEAYAFLLKLK
jgi:hypothetical protein